MEKDNTPFRIVTDTLVRVTEFFGNGRKRMEYSMLGGKKEGMFTLWGSNGELLAQCRYKHGVLDGREQMWYPHGAIRYICDWKDGRQTGTVMRWRADGSSVPTPSVTPHVTVCDNTEKAESAGWHFSR